MLTGDSNPAAGGVPSASPPSLPPRLPRPQDYIGYIFTNDPDVVATVSSIALFGVAFQVRLRQAGRGQAGPRCTYDLPVGTALIAAGTPSATVTEQNAAAALGCAGVGWAGNARPYCN